MVPQRVRVAPGCVGVETECIRVIPECVQVGTRKYERGTQIVCLCVRDNTINKQNINSLITSYINSNI